MGELKGKRAIVTGAGQGIGTSIAESLIRAGCETAIHYYTSQAGAEGLKELADSLGVEAEIFQADLTKEKKVVGFVKAAVKFLGGLEILVNNTGDLVSRVPLDEIDVGYWQKVVDVNMTSMMLVTREAKPYLLEANGASIVNLSSLAGRKGGGNGSSAYATMKGAILAWTRTLAAELGPKGVRVNAVAPGLILGTRFHDTHTPVNYRDKMIAGIPIGRAGTPEEVARAVKFLAAEYDGFITGATLDINGGVYCA
jgi:3-oxoacyl-[acyl-carrier protein] reductase